MELPGMMQTLAPDVKQFPPWTILVIAFLAAGGGGGMWLAWLS